MQNKILVCLFFLLLGTSQFLCVKAESYSDTISVFQWNPPKNQWENDRRIIQIYESNALSSYLIYQYDTTTHEWSQYKRISFQYNEAGHKTTETHYFWNDTVKDWRKDKKIDFSYAGSLKKECITYIYDLVQERWVRDKKIRYTYTGANLHKKTVYNEWNTANNEWHRHWREIFEYSDDQRSKWQHEQYNPNEGWSSRWKYLYTYVEGHLVKRVHKLKDSNTWMPLSKNTFLYEQDHRKQWNIYYWNQQDSGWLKQRKFSYSYQGNVLKNWTAYTWDKTGNTWKNHLSSQYEYTSNGNLKEVSGQEWRYDIQKDSSRWYNDDRLALYYNADRDSLEKLILYDDYTSGQSLAKAKKILYKGYTSKNEIQNNKAATENIQVYPNPVLNGPLYVKASPTIKIKKILVMDYLGKPLKIIHNTRKFPVPVQVDDVHTKVLMLRITLHNGDTYVKKVINN